MCIRKTQWGPEREGAEEGRSRGGKCEQAGVGEEPLSIRERLPGNPPGMRRQPARSSAVGILAGDPYGVQTLFSCTLGK